MLWCLKADAVDEVEEDDGWLIGVSGSMVLLLLEGGGDDDDGGV